MALSFIYDHFHIIVIYDEEYYAFTLFSSLLQPNAGQQHYENICMKAVNQSIGELVILFICNTLLVSMRLFHNVSLEQSKSDLYAISFHSFQELTSSLGNSKGLIMMAEIAAC